MVNATTLHASALNFGWTTRYGHDVEFRRDKILVTVGVRSYENKIQPMYPTVTRNWLFIALLHSAGSVFADDMNASAVAAYEKAIDEVMQSRGGEHPDLIEHYVGLAFSQRGVGDHGAAAGSFGQALYLERIHKGLEHPDQIALIEQLFRSHRAASNWGEANQNLTLLAWVNERTADRSETAYLNALEKLSRWHLQASQSDPTTEEYEHIRSALQHIDKALETLPPDGGAARLPWLYLKADACYRATGVLSREVAQDYHRVQGRVQGRAFIAYSDFEFGDAIYARNLMTRHYAAGIGALKSAKEFAASAGNAAKHAESTLKLADWHQLFGRTQSANTLYAEAKRIADTAGVELFDSHRRLPDFIRRDSHSNAANSNSDGLRFVRTRFDVDKKGRARNVEILETHPPNAHRLAREARARLKATRFRPRFEGQSAAVTTGVEMRFVFPERRG